MCLVVDFGSSTIVDVVVVVAICLCAIVDDEVVVAVDVAAGVKDNGEGFRSLPMYFSLPKMKIIVLSKHHCFKLEALYIKLM